MRDQQAFKVARSKGIRYLIFLVVPTSVSYVAVVGQQGTSFVFRQGILGALTQGNLPCGTLDLENVSVAGDMWEWLQQSLVPLLYADTDYDGMPLPRAENQYLLNGVTRLVGGLRIRQVRCHVYML